MRISPLPMIAACTLAIASATPAAAAGVDSYVNAVFAGAPSGSVPLFYKSVCPAAYGLSDSLNGAIADRMRAVAAAAGLKVEAKGCHANILLFVPKDRAQLLAQLRLQRPELFGRTSDQLSGDPQSSASVLAWQLLDKRGADGRSLGGGYREGEPTVQQAVTSSRLLPGSRSDLDLAVVVLDTQSALGLTATQLGDYALVRALLPSKAGEPADPGVPSILTLMRDKAANKASPLSVTAWDIAFLKALYGDAGLDNAGAQRARVAEAMKRAVPQSASAD